MKKMYYLSTCDTCKRIIEELPLGIDMEMREIKSQPVSLEELDEMYQRAGSYEALFSKRARLYKERDLKTKVLNESDYKQLLLEHYTFLKRPVILLDNEIFIGNSSKTVAAAREALIR